MIPLSAPFPARVRMFPQTDWIKPLCSPAFVAGNIYLNGQKNKVSKKFSLLVTPITFNTLKRLWRVEAQSSLLSQGEMPKIV